jgi:hypothetical protein
MPESTLPPLEDPVHEKEIFASEICGVGMIHGNIAITLANIRFDDSVAGQALKAHRVVVGRLMLTTPAAGQLLNSLQQVAAQLEASSKAKQN